MARTSLKISYCTPCKGRLHHLKETLPANLAAEKNNANVEFVVLDYGSEDGLEQWIRDNFSRELSTRKLLYAKVDPQDAPTFKMAHAKNMAHRLASGDVICNLDADNFIAPDTSHWLNKQFMNHDHRIVHIHPLTRRGVVKKIIDRGSQQIAEKMGRPVEVDKGCLGGRIAMLREDFERLGGYDENFSAWGFDDTNMAFRARDIGLRKVEWPSRLKGDAIDHGKDERVSQMSEEDRELSMKRLNRSLVARTINAMRQVKVTYDPIVNDGNVGCGKVRVNFMDGTQDIRALDATTESQRKGETKQQDESAAKKKNDWAMTHGTRLTTQDRRFL